MPVVRADGVPSHPNDVTPEWLTTCLTESGALSSGAVATVTIDQIRTSSTAHTARLRLEFGANAGKQAPCSLFLKVSGGDTKFARFVERECAFYSRKFPEGMPVARCYYTHYDSTSGIGTFLLDDLSDSHWNTPWPLPPSLPLCDAAVRELARLHACCWVDPRSKAPRATGPQRQASDETSPYVERTLPKFLDYLGDRLPPERRAIARLVSEKLPALLQHRTKQDMPTTLVHGDAHFWNVMLPKNRTRDRCIFIDWQTWAHGVGAFDLAYMIALHWYPDRRARHERPLLRSYHKALGHDITSRYVWDEFQFDYRLGHLSNLGAPIYQWDIGLFPAIWWPHLERWFLTYNDLHCSELLQ